MWGSGDVGQQAAIDAAPAFQRVADSLREGQRMHMCLQGRYVTLLRHNGQLACIVSICFHAGGPLGVGDIEDVGGRPCLSCPWHYYKVDLVSGDKYFQSVNMVEGKMLPGPWKSSGVKQRTHVAEERGDGIYVALQLEGHVPSDGYASNTTCGERMLEAGSGPGGGVVGADGKRLPRSGQVFQQGGSSAGQPVDKRLQRLQL